MVTAQMKRARDTQAQRAIEMFEARMPVKVVNWSAHASQIWIEYKRADAEDSKWMPAKTARGFIGYGGEWIQRL